MKKVFALLILGLFLCAGNAFAAATSVADSDNGTTGGKELWAATPDVGLIGKMSKGVKITGITSNTHYTIFTAHVSGTKKYGSADDSTAIFSQEYTAGTALDTPTTVGVVEFATAWTAL